MTGPPPARRHYDATLRRRRAAETRERIVAAGCEILRRASIRDWRALTVRAAAESAGVNERTVYRHFGNERGLRDAVMHRLEERAGIELTGLRLEDVADVTARILQTVASHPLEPRRPLDSTLSDASRRQREALLEAVAAATDQWSRSDRTVAAAMFDALWGVATYERLAIDWQLEPARAVEGVAWVIRLLEEAVRTDRRPSRARLERDRRTDA